jgi:hypothetical protein
MQPEFKSRQLSFLLQCVLVTIVLYAIHSYLLYYLAKDVKLFFPVFHIYIFHFLVTTVFYTIINYRFSKGKKDIFNLFMGSTFVKMGLAILFLLPLILSDFEKKQPDVFNFFIPYFLYLFFEVIFITKLLNEKP